MSYKNEINFDYPYSLSKVSNFYYLFESLKKKLHIRRSRKSNLDCFLKKIKCQFFQMLYELVRSSLKINIKRLPRKFIYNVSIALNQRYLTKTVIELYQSFNKLPSYTFLEENNLIKTESKQIFLTLMSTNLMALYKQYIKSQRFLKDYQNIKNKFGKNMVIIYNFVGNNFVEYYMNNISYSRDLNNEKRFKTLSSKHFVVNSNSNSFTNLNRIAINSTNASINNNFTNYKNQNINVNDKRKI